MRFAVLMILATAAALVFVTMMGTTVLQGRAPTSESGEGHSVWTQCLWVMVPWLMMAVCVFPAVRRILAAN